MVINGRKHMVDWKSAMLKTEVMLLAVLFASIVAATFAGAAQAEPQLQFGGNLVKTEAMDPITDDPLPHLHRFYCNKSVNPGSTFLSLRENPDSSCTFSISSYWYPVEWEGGKEVLAPRATFYYSAWGQTSDLVMFPDNAAMIGTVEDYRCGNGPSKTRPPYGCAESKWRTRVHFQECWNGVGNDPDDFSYRSGKGCPSAFPYHIPVLRQVFHHPNPDVVESPLLVAAGNGGFKDYTFTHADVMSVISPELEAKLRDCVLEPPGTGCTAAERNEEE